MARNLKYTLFMGVLAMALHQVLGFSKGAPESEMICKTLTPKHKDKVPQTSPFPYTVTLDKTVVAPEDVIRLTINGDFINNVTIKGFLVQGRKVNYEVDEAPVGVFLVDEKAQETQKGLACGGVADSTVTHVHNNEKYEVSTNWMAPKEPGEYVLLTTVVKDGYTFWVRNPSAQITVM